LKKTKLSVLEQKLFKKFSNLSQFKDLSEKEILGLVEAKIDSMKKPKIKDKDLAVADLFSDKAEQKAANSLLHKYLDQFSIENISDKNTLSQLIYLEVFNKRLQEILNRIEDEKDVPSLKLVDSLHKNLTQITALKGSLGLNNKSETKTDSWTALETLKKKFKVWRNDNQASRTMICPHCGKMTLLKIRTEGWEAQKHPYFKDRVLGNTELIKIYKQGRLGKGELADILECSTDYIDWLVEKWKQIPADKNEGTIQVIIQGDEK